MSEAALRRRAAAFRARVESLGAVEGLAYPWWIVIFSAGGQIGFVLIAAAQRGVLLRPPPAWVALAMVIVPNVAYFLATVRVPGWLCSACVLPGVGWLMLGYPILGSSTSPLDVIADAAAAVLTIAVAEAVVVDGLRAGCVALIISIAAVVVAAAGPEVVVVHVVEVLFGFDVGYMLRWQMRALAAERAARAGERDRATLAERQRIAREIHDLVGHSLSVTLLHVTGARRALQQDRDIDDAISALTDAERIGREAMADIRRTVGVLGAGGHDARPLPTASDIDHLVADLRAAGVQITFDATGDLGAVPPATGLGIYRIAQESLANVAKYAPETVAHVHLEIDTHTARLRVSNPLPARAGVVGEGTGIPGMSARATQLGGSLRAGTEGRCWLVELTVPILHPSDPDIDHAAIGRAADPATVPGER